MIFETVRELLAHQLEVDPESIGPDTDIFDDLGADSLDVVELVMSIEEEYDIVITDEPRGQRAHGGPGSGTARRSGKITKGMRPRARGRIFYWPCLRFGRGRCILFIE